jgi:hypothetical protein
MNKKSHIQAGSPEGPVLVEARLPENALNPAETKEIPTAVLIVHQPADEIPSAVPLRQTFRLPKRLVEDLVRA